MSKWFGNVMNVYEDKRFEFLKRFNMSYLLFLGFIVLDHTLLLFIEAIIYWIQKSQQTSADVTNTLSVILTLFCSVIVFCIWNNHLYFSISIDRHL